MRAPTIVLAWVAALAAGCGGKVIWVSGHGDGSGGDASSSASTSGQGGGAPGPHAMPIDVAGESSPIFCGDWQHPRAGVHVFSNAANGSLLDEADTDATGKATLLTIDGGYASAVMPGSDGFPPTIYSVAITSGVSHVHFGFPSNDSCQPEPMHVHVDVPPQPLAAPWVTACNASAPVDTATWTAELDVGNCSYDGTFAVVLLGAQGDETIVSTSKKTPWVSGGTASVAIQAPPPVVEVHALSKNSDAGSVADGYWAFDVDGISEFPDALAVAQAGPDASITWSLPAAPEIHIQMQHSLFGCDDAGWYLDADSSVLAAHETTLDPARLARPKLDPSGVWRLEDGDLGDAVFALRRFGTQDDEIWWQQEMPAAAQITLPNLTLPAAFQGFFPPGPEWLIEVDNIDRREAASYAELLDLSEPKNWGATYIEEANTGCAK